MMDPGARNGQVLLPLLCSALSLALAARTRGFKTVLAYRSQSICVSAACVTSAHRTHMQTSLGKRTSFESNVDRSGAKDEARSEKRQGEPSIGALSSS